MPRTKTPSFSCELPLRVTPADERQLLVRLDCARMVYNACLGECLKRLRLMRASQAFQAARQLPWKANERRAAFASAREQFGFREYDLHAYAVQFGHSWLGDHLDSASVQTLATRAFLTTDGYAVGKRGRPRFKGRGSFDSVEGKTNGYGIRWRADRVKWLGLELPARIDPDDEVIAYGLTCRVKYVRIVRRKLNGRNRFFAQLTCEGRPYRKEQHQLGKGVLGLDLGPSTIATVSADGKVAQLERFCDELRSKTTIIRRLQRKLERQRRANTPLNRHPNSVTKKGARDRHVSRRFAGTRNRLAELHRKQAAHRKSLHGRMVNRVLRQGATINLEKLSYLAFQRAFGKSVDYRGPGTFVDLLRRKAANAGAEIFEFNPGPTRLSQTCLCGRRRKKSLSERWHHCDCGVGPIQRDLLSAWLACFVATGDGRLDAGRAQAAWPSVDARLRTASSEIQPAMGQGNPPNLHLAASAGQSRSSAKSGEPADDTRVTGGSQHRRESVVRSERPGLRPQGVVR